MNAAGFAIVVLNRLEDVRNLAISSSSAMTSGSPEASMFATYDFDDIVDNSRRNILSIKSSNGMPFVCAV